MQCLGMPGWEKMSGSQVQIMNNSQQGLSPWHGKQIHALKILDVFTNIIKTSSQQLMFYKALICWHFNLNHNSTIIMISPLYPRNKRNYELFYLPSAFNSTVDRACTLQYWRLEVSNWKNEYGESWFS